MIQYPSWLKIKRCKRIDTFDLENEQNGYLIDILNRNDEIMKTRNGELFQQFYISSVLKNKFKGLHIHPVKEDIYYCLSGKICLVFYPEIIENKDVDKIKLDTNKFISVELEENNPLTISFPSKYPHGFFGIDDLSIIINYRNPAWTLDDNLQYEIKCDEIIKKLRTKYKMN